jgi:hypothetical protein
MFNMDRKAIQKLCAEALESVKSVLPEESYEYAYGYIHEYGEWGLGVECIIDSIGDLELSITEPQFLAIENAMVAMNWGDSNRMISLRKIFQSQSEEDM